MSKPVLTASSMCLRRLLNSLSQHPQAHKIVPQAVRPHPGATFFKKMTLDGRPSRHHASQHPLSQPSQTFRRCLAYHECLTYRPITCLTYLPTTCLTYRPTTCPIYLTCLTSSSRAFRHTTCSTPYLAACLLCATTFKVWM